MQSRVAQIVAALSSGPKDLRLLQESLDDPDIGIAELADVMQALVVTGITFPCADTAGERDGWPDINRVLVKLAADEQRPQIPLVSPRLGVALLETASSAQSMQAMVDSGQANAKSAEDRRMALLGCSRALD